MDGKSHEIVEVLAISHRELERTVCLRPKDHEFWKSIDVQILTHVQRVFSRTVDYGNSIVSGIGISVESSGNLIDVRHDSVAKLAVLHFEHQEPVGNFSFLIFHDVVLQIFAALRVYDLLHDKLSVD